MTTTPSVQAADAFEFEQNEAGEFVCPECGNTYGKRAGARRHMTEKHGWPGAKNKGGGHYARERKKRGEEPPAPPVDPDSVSFQVRSELRELALPLKEKLATIDRRLVEIARETADLREAKTQIERTLRGLEGTPATVKATTGGGMAGESYRKKLAAAEEYLTKNPASADLRGGFTQNALMEGLRRDGVTPAIGAHVLPRIINDLHERGIIRLDSVAQGGGKLWVLVGRNGTSED